MVTTLNTNYDFDMYHKNKLMRFEENFFFIPDTRDQFFCRKLNRCSIAENIINFI